MQIVNCKNYTYNELEKFQYLIQQPYHDSEYVNWGKTEKGLKNT